MWACSDFSRGKSLSQNLHLMGLPLCAPSIIRLLTISALGLPRLPESWFLFRSGDIKSRGCLSGVRQNGEDLDNLSDNNVLSGAIFLPGVSGVSDWSSQNEDLSRSDFGVEKSENKGVTGVMACKFVTVWFSFVGVNADP